MALFKIEKGLATNLSKNRPNTIEGYCYVTTDDGKFYIDTGTGNGTSKRIVLNAGSADKLATARAIKLDGKVTGSASFDGSQDVTINVDTSEIDEAIATLPNSASDGIKIENNIIKHTNSVTEGTVSEGGISRTLAFGGTFNVPSVDYDAQGHIKSKSSITLTLPANPNTDTKVTSAANHYTPAEDTSAALSVDASGATNAAAWNSTNLVTGVNLKRDAKGHVVGVTVDSIKMPSNPDTNTTYTLSGQFNSDGTEYITTLTPNNGTATTAGIPLMTAASSTADGAPGLVPKASAGNQAKFLKANGTWATPTDTKNTAGSTNSSSKLFLIGATSQAANPQTYSHDTAYIGTDGCLYSNNTKVSVAGHTHSVSVSTGTVKAVNSVGTMFTASVSDEVLVLTAGSAPTTTNATVVTSVGTTTGGA